LYFALAAFTGLGDNDYYVASVLEACLMICYLLFNLFLAAYILGGLFPFAHFAVCMLFHHASSDVHTIDGMQQTVINALKVAPCNVSSIVRACCVTEVEAVQGAN
jgi:hypothetical protein